MADPLGKAGRVARSRAACSACRATKQRCDGPSRIPCRRCELYGLECEYSSASGPAPSKPAVARTVAYTPPIYGGPSGSGDNMMADRLREISERLRSIESSLANVHITAPTYNGSTSNDRDPSESPGSVPSLIANHQSSDSSTESSHSTGHGVDAGHLLGATASNPLQTVISQISMLENITKEKGSSPGSPPGDWSSFQGTMSSLNSAMEKLFAGITMPDAITRNIMSAQECDASFQIFFAKIAPWLMFFDESRDRNASAMRERNPLLFHAILLTTSYYLMEASDRGSHVYYSLTALVNELIAPLIISPQAHQVTPDFVKALCLLLVYKPVQFASLYSSNIVEPEAAEQACKLNSFSSSILGGLMGRTALAIHLSTAPTVFSKTFSPSIAIAPKILSDLRIWFFMLIVDNHGALTTGRASLLDMSEALKTTRLFASLKSQTGDVRLAAQVELYATTRGALGSIWTSNTRTVATNELKRFNKDFDAWESYWEGPLHEAAAAGDQLAQTATLVFGSSVRLTLNATVFSRWQTEHQQSLASGGNGRPDLSDDDWNCLQLAVRAVERLVYCLSMESRVNGNPFRREVNWSSKANGPRPPLTLDPVVVAIHQTAVDPITCVLYSFALITVAKMANAGLIVCELKCMPDTYASGVGGDRPQRLISGAKLGHLLELGASFLEAIAPTRSHPARKHSRMLRAIFAAGTIGQEKPVDPDMVVSAITSASQRNEAVDLAAILRDLSRRRSSSGSDGFPTPAFTMSPASYPSPTQYSPPSGVPVTISQPLQAPPPPAPLPQPIIARQEEPGEALAAILGGLSPQWLGQMGYFDPNQGTGLDASMSVDWDSLEKSMNLQPVPQYQHQPVFSNMNGYF